MLSSIDTIEIRNVLATDPQQSNVADITTAEQWVEKRPALKSTLWDLLGKPEQFAQFLPGMPHDVNRYSRLLSLGWLETWLVG